MKFKKTISPVVAIALLLVVSVVAVVSFHTWFDTYSSGIYGNVEIQSQSSTESVSIETVVGDQLYVKGDGNLSIKQVLIDGVECNISVNISGVGNVSLSDCLDSATSKTPEITIVTDSKVISKKIYLAEINPSNSDSQVGSVLPSNSNAFISVWNTSKSGASGNTQIILPLESSGVYSFDVVGDNLVGSPIHIDDYNDNILNFTTEGIQEISITGTIKGFKFGSSGDALKIIEIKAWGPLNLGNSASYFSGCKNLIYSGSDTLNLTGTTDLQGMFWDATNFNGNINNWDVSHVTNMVGMFQGAINFNSDISNWDVSSVTDMGLMFGNAFVFNSDISNWDVSSVKYFTGMFQSANSFNQDLSNWNTSSAITMRTMFDKAHQFNSDISGWNVSLVVDMYSMFDGNFNNFNQDLSSWDVDQVTVCSDFYTDTQNRWVLPKPNFTNCIP